MNVTNTFKFGIRQKLLLLLTIILLTALTISGWFAIQQEKENTFNEFDRRGHEISRFVAKSLAYSVVGYDYHTIDLLLTEIIKSEEIDYAKVENKKGKPMSAVGKISEADKKNIVLFQQDIYLGSDRIGKLTLGMNKQESLNKLETKWFALIKREAIIIFLIAFGEFLALSFIVIRPVSVITKSLNEQVEKDGQIIGTIPITTNDEFGGLATQFNLLSHNLNAANSKLQSRADFADKELTKTNLILQKQSEELSAINKELHEIAITDALTGLYNRRYFEDVISNKMEISKRHGDTNSLIMVDIDFFKKINDTYGHDKGDIVLKEVALIMDANLRKSDILCRIGGEEFAVICSHANHKSAVIIANKLRERIEQHKITIGDDTISITISLGIATIHKDNLDTHFDNLYRFADTALYASKDTGRNKITHYDDIKI